MTRQEQVYQDKIAWAMSTIEERDGYCLVGSQSEPTKHVVTVNEQLYSELCTCKAGKSDQDCYHKIAVDRYYDDRRPAFHADTPVMLSAVRQARKTSEQELARIDAEIAAYIEAELEAAAKANRPASEQKRIVAVLSDAEKRSTAPLYRQGFQLLR